jgi:serine protease Do
LALLLLISGCQSGYQDFYHPAYPNPTQAPPLVPLTEGASPEVVGSDDVDRDVRALLAKNYSVIGVSSFNGAFENEKKALEQARRVGATVVLMTSRYTNTLTNSTLPLDKSPYPARIVRESTSSYRTGMESVPITKTQVRYDQTAVYLAKRQKMLRFGMFLRDPTPELRADLKMDAGALVIVVVEGSSAFNANVLPGDVLVAIDGSSVVNAEQGSDLMRQFGPAATQAVLSVIRDGKATTLVIAIPPA